MIEQGTSSDRMDPAAAGPLPRRAWAVAWNRLPEMIVPLPGLEDFFLVEPGVFANRSKPPADAEF
jgi:hypothetical protein